MGKPEFGPAGDPKKLAKALKGLITEPALPPGYRKEPDNALVNHKTYLGDGVYVSIERAMVRLTVEEGVGSDPQQLIYLEVGPLRRLMDWLAWLSKSDKEDLM